MSPKTTFKRKKALDHGRVEALRGAYNLIKGVLLTHATVVEINAGREEWYLLVKLIEIAGQNYLSELAEFRDEMYETVKRLVLVDLCGKIKEWGYETVTTQCSGEAAQYVLSLSLQQMHSIDKADLKNQRKFSRPRKNAR
jgi:hypothetical protein